MLSSLFESFFPQEIRLESQAGVHAGESQATQSDTATSTISDPEEAQKHKDALGEKQEQAQEDDEDEEEPEDQAEAIREACGNTKVCKEFKHHLEECGERLAAGKTIVPNETCVEELFHYMHCVDECAAPKIFAALK